MPDLQPRTGFSLFIFRFILVIWVVLSFLYDNNKRPIITSDAVHYWSYLPAAFVEKDLTLSFLTDNPADHNYRYFPEPAPGGGKVIKVTMGLALLLTPFFLIGHLIAPVFGEPRDGFSQVYQTMTGMVGIFFYLMLGLWCLRKTLQQFFTDRISGITLLVLFGGTNLLYYSFAEPLLAHTMLFSLMAVFLYGIVQWHQKPLLKYAIIIGFAGGFITLIRPTMVLFMLIPFLYGIYSLASFKERLRYDLQHWSGILLALTCCIIVGLPQLIYWKYNTGHWLFFSYTNERFFWNQPHLIDMWFSYRKGWFMYTPVMLFAIAGFWWMRRYAKELLLSSIVVLPVTFYVLSCWWVWWYGGSISQRTYVEFYPLLAFPLASSFSRINESKKMRNFWWALIFLFSVFSAFKVWQYCRKYIHHDGMNRKLYWESIAQFEEIDSYWSKLHMPNYSRALRGLNLYTEEESKQLLIRDDLEFNTDSTNGNFCFPDSVITPPTLTVAFANLRIPHSNYLYALVDFTTSARELSDSCRLVMEIKSKDSTLLYSSVPLNQFITKEGKGHARVKHLFIRFITEEDILRVYVQNPRAEKLCVDNLYFCEEVYN